MVESIAALADNTSRLTQESPQAQEIEVSPWLKGSVSDRWHLDPAL